ncbi:hypothetical protein ABZ644_25035 [Nocardiopsis alba]|uniref:hypothetical protein n=1 Tax=Nocardiopsis alba TaxID=53437 RepID=UPI0033E059FA
MFNHIRARLAAWIAPTTPAPAAADHSTADHSTANTTGDISGSARVVQARDIDTLNTGDTHTHHHTGDTHTSTTVNALNGDIHGGNVVMSHQGNGPAVISGTTGDIIWGNTGVINTGNARVQTGHVSGGTIIA